jgi:CBS domain containing-hemolysin-like protein
LDPEPVLFNLILVVLLVLLNGFFVAAEFAMVKVRSSRLEALVLEGNARAKFAQKLTSNLDGYLSATQLGITLASLGLGWIGEPAIAELIRPALNVFGFSEAIIHTIAFAVAFSIMTVLHIVLGELAPKSVAIQKSEAVTMWSAPLLIGFYKLMYPFIWLLNNAANWLLRMIGIQPASEHEAAHTEEEIRILMKESHKSGHIDQTELALVDNIFDFSDRNAREIMIPRMDMVCLYAQNTFEENLEIALREQMTRYPVCDPDKDNIIGFVHIKDLFSSTVKANNKNLDTITRNVITVPETISISSLLKIMQKKRSQLAIVIDEYGGTAGLLTIEDIIEEIVGEIQDEFDEERQPIEAKGKETYSIEGRLLIEEANDFLGINIDMDEVDTIGGWMYSKVESPPRVNQRVEFAGFEFIISEVDHLRINRILVKNLNAVFKPTDNMHIHQEKNSLTIVN